MAIQKNTRASSSHASPAFRWALSYFGVPDRHRAIVWIQAVDNVASEQLMPGENCGRHMPLVENVQGQCDQFLPVALGEKCDRPNQLCARARSSWRASGMAP